MTGGAAQSHTWGHLLWAVDIAYPGTAAQHTTGCHGKQLGPHRWGMISCCCLLQPDYGYLCSQICASVAAVISTGGLAWHVDGACVWSVGLLRWVAGRCEHEVMPLHRQAAVLLVHRPAAGCTANEEAGLLLPSRPLHANNGC